MGNFQSELIETHSETLLAFIIIIFHQRNPKLEAPPIRNV